jgi:hypothetical protein
MIPTGPGKTKVENEVYRHKSATDVEFAAINEFYKQVLNEDKMLCEDAQKNLEAGVFVNGELHPDKEKGPIWFQHTVRDAVMKHRHEELAQGGVEIWPATPKVTGEMNTAKLHEEQLFCSQLEVEGCRSDDQLAW